MNSSEFLQQLQALGSADWVALCAGQALLLVDDARLEPGPANTVNVIIPPATDPALDPTRLREASLARAAQILEEYYRTHPLTAIGFKTQVEGLFARFGPAAFAAAPGRSPDYSLFVESGTVVAESRQSPRHPYGAYCDLGRPLADAALREYVARWLDSGEAYDRYLSMNVCRYNC